MGFCERVRKRERGATPGVGAWMGGQGLIRRLGALCLCLCHIVLVPANSHFSRQGITFTPPFARNENTSKQNS